MRNQYGADLRELITADYAVDTVISMHDVDAFEDDVSAYPAIVVLRNERTAQGRRRRRQRPLRRGGGPATLRLGSARTTQHRRRQRRTRRRESRAGSAAATCGRRDRHSQLALIADLEARFPPLQDPATGTRVGIGVATGCDDVFITDRSRPRRERSPPAAPPGARHHQRIRRLVGPVPRQPVERTSGLVDLDRLPAARRVPRRQRATGFELGTSPSSARRPGTARSTASITA